jgi:hypothetical protein
MNLFISKAFIREGCPVSYSFTANKNISMTNITPEGVIVFSRRRDTFKLRNGRMYQFLRQPGLKQPVAPHQPKAAILRFM